MIDRRELILVYLEALLKTIAPGVVFPLPGPPHRPIVTDLRGQVFTQMIPEARFANISLPAVELLTSASEEDTIREAASDEMYLATLHVDVLGYVRAPDTGSSGTARVRTEANALRADLIVAIESLPYWTSADFPESLRRRCGEITTTLTSQFTEAPLDIPTGFTTVSYAITYAFSRTNP